MKKESKKEEFLRKAIAIHVDEVDFSMVDYVNSQTKVCLVCPKHGKYLQKPSVCLKGSKCPKCANEARSQKGEKSMTTEKFIEKSIEVHKGKYRYDKTSYVNPNTKITITCPIHGDFLQLPYAHLKGQGCPKCKGRGMDKDGIVNKFREIHGDNYDYSEFTYINGRTKSTIICPVHGKFEQSASKHLLGQGCPKCGIEKRAKKQSSGFDGFVKRANIIHDNKYDYQRTEISSQREHIEIECPIHGTFTQLVYDHLNGHGCPICGKTASKAENEIASMLSELNVGEIKLRDREVIYPYEVDIHIVDIGIAIEYCGLRWHSDQFKENKHYHLEKLNKCKSKGIKLVTIFEDEYIEQPDIVNAKLRQLVNRQQLPRIMGRQCEIKDISNDDASLFFKKNHIQGYSAASVRLGAYFNDKLIGAMLFRRDGKHWELSRCATDIKFHCVGICGKLFKHFIKTYNPESVKSFADRRWTINDKHNLYTQLGFELDCVLSPDYSYVTPNGKRIHKFNCRKQLLLSKYADKGLSSEMTESQITEKLGFHKIWNCGLLRYVWNKQK